jgi:DNA transposition AAA+ family ATPase
VRAQRPLRRIPAELPSRHWEGTDGARDVATSTLKSATTLIGEAILDAGLAVLTGEPGLGKTFTARSIAERLSIPAHYYEARRGVRGKSIELDLLKALGADFDPRDPRRDLQDAIVEACGRQRLVIVDELDRIGDEGVDVLRWVWSQPGNRAAFVFVGHKLEGVLASNPALDSRVERRIKFRPLTAEEVVALLPEYHAIYEGASEALLVRLHSLTDGRFREIAQMTKQLLLDSPQPYRRLTQRVLEDAWGETGRRAA